MRPTHDYLCCSSTACLAQSDGSRAIDQAIDYTRQSMYYYCNDAREAKTLDGQLIELPVL